MATEKPWKKWKDNELVAEAFHNQGEAAVEMMRRLKKSNTVLAVVNIALTLLLLVVAVLQLRH